MRYAKGGVLHGKVDYEPEIGEEIVPLSDDIWESLDGWGKQIAGKLNNSDDSLLTEDSEACKEQKSKLDCISRQDAIEAVEKHAKIFGEHSCPDEFSKGAVDGLLRAKELLEYLPPVTPTERTGEWEHDGSDWENRWVCSECGYKLFEEQTTYCGNCGSYNGGEK